MQTSLMLYRSQDGSELRLMQQCGTKTIRYFDRAPSLIEIERIDRGSTGLPDREAHRRAVNRECTRFLQHYTPPPLLAMHRTFLAAPPCACQGVALALPLKRHLSSPQCAGQAERETSKVKTQPRVAWSTRTALKSKKLKPKRSLGQNFLQREEVLRAIVAAAELQSGDRVLEIGPGTGNLTRCLLETGARVTAVEKDDALYAALLEQFDQVAADSRLAPLHLMWQLGAPRAQHAQSLQLFSPAFPDIRKHHFYRRAGDTEGPATLGPQRCA